MQSTVKLNLFVKEWKRTCFCD